MSDQEKKRSKKYNRVREKFDKLPLEEKATFLVEALFTTLTRGIEQAGKAFSDELNSMFEQAREQAEKASQEAKEASEEEERTDGSGDEEEENEPGQAPGEETDDESAEEED